ncbi:putative DAN domain protein [Trypoxylus dichotomus]
MQLFKFNPIMDYITLSVRLMYWQRMVKKSIRKVIIYLWRTMLVLILLEGTSLDFLYHNAVAEATSSTDECRLTPAIRRIKYEGCSSKPIHTFGCTGRCSSYLQVSGSKIWQLIRSCMCCQESGEREASVIIYCVNPSVSEDKRFRKFQVSIKAPLSCMCRPCVDLESNSVVPQELAGYSENSRLSSHFLL